MHGQIREHDPTLAAGEALLVEQRSVRLQSETLYQRDPNAQDASSALAPR